MRESSLYLPVINLYTMSFQKLLKGYLVFMLLFSVLDISVERVLSYLKTVASLAFVLVPHILFALITLREHGR